MEYVEYNQKVLNYYLSRTQSGFFSFSMDRTELNNLIELDDIASFNCLHDNWISLLHEKDGIPLYFGLIALQCVAGSIMENDGKNISERVYQLRLQQILQLPYKNMQDLFKGKDIYPPSQEQIWLAAKDYMLKKYGIHLDLPTRRQYKGRFIQYPLSQVLLNTEELKYFTIFFSETFIVGENIPFSCFKTKLDVWYPTYVSKKVSNALSSSLRGDSCKAQLFNYFQCWDGTIYKKTKKFKIVERKATLSIVEARMLLIFNEESPSFWLNGEEIPAEKLFAMDYFYFHDGIMLFNPYLEYNDSYEDSRLLLTGNRTLYILLNRSTANKVYNYLEQYNLAKFSLTSRITLYNIHADYQHHHYLLRQYFYQVNPVLLSNGIKLNHKTYLQGFGPVINYDNEWKILFNHQPVHFDPTTALSGVYCIRTNNYKDIIFDIAPSPTPILIPQEKIGWDLKKMTINDSPTLEGCCYYPTPLATIHPIRNWINTLIGQNKSNQQLRNRILNHASQ